jgi:hypothetical protein
LLKASSLLADLGTFSLTGQDAGLLAARQLLAEAGAYALTGQDAGLLKASLLACVLGEYTLTGNDAALTYTPQGAFLLTADTGAYLLTGQAASLLKDSILACGTGAYVLTGNAVGLSINAGATVILFQGVSSADGPTRHQGISRPTIILTDAGGGFYTVEKTYQVSGNFNPESVSAETYLIDGELP